MGFNNRLRSWLHERREWRAYDRGAGPLPAEAAQVVERLRALNAEASSLPEDVVERYRELTSEEVRKEAARVQEELREQARREGFARTLSATEEDDWIKLDFELRLSGASTIGELPPTAADEWAKRMAVHARRREDGGLA